MHTALNDIIERFIRWNKEQAQIIKMIQKSGQNKEKKKEERNVCEWRFINRQKGEEWIAQSTKNPA